MGGIGSGKETRFKVNPSEARIWFLNHIIDEDGNRLSLRALWNSDEFKEYSGMVSDIEGKEISNGTMSYWLYKKWNLTEDVILQYHQFITHRLSKSLKVSEFGRRPDVEYVEEGFDSLDLTKFNKRRLVIALKKLFNREEFMWSVHREDPDWVIATAVEAFVTCRYYGDIEEFRIDLLEVM